jgi:D-sedoheptulose 7-phosphate isomerase
VADKVISDPRTASAQESARRAIRESIEVKAKLLEQQLSTIARLSEIMVDALQQGKKLVLFGNGGSAADAQHVVAELVGQFEMKRDTLAAIALTTDTSILTSLGNDRGFDQLFSRQVQALVQVGDVAVGISTSGNSSNVNNGIIAAKAKGATTVGFTGRSGGELKELVDICCHVPSESTARIQETQITIWHALCEVIEREIFDS